MTTEIKLPSFSLRQKQPKVPHVARTVIKRDVPNKHGTPITYRVEQSRNGKSWWISASLNEWRASNTLHTTVPAKADAWIKAIKTGAISVADIDFEEA